MADHTDPAPETPQVPTTVSRRPMTAEEVERLWLAYLEPEKPPTYLELAQQFDRHRQTIAAHLQGPEFERYKDAISRERRNRAAARLATQAERAADLWGTAMENAADKGDHRPAKELLQAVGVVGTDTSGSTNVAVVFVGDGVNAIGEHPIAAFRRPPVIEGTTA